MRDRPTPLFTDAYEAGERLGTHLATLAPIAALDHDETVIVGVTEGGLPLAYMVSAALPMRIEPAPVASIHAPYQRDVRVGMLVDDGTLYLEEQLGIEHGAYGSTLDHLVDRADSDLMDLMRTIGDAPRAAVDGMDVIIIDDIIDTGMTTIACVDWVRRWGARSVHMAAAVATPRGLERARTAADTVVVLELVDRDFELGDVFGRNVASHPKAVANLAAAMGVFNLGRDHD